MPQRTDIERDEANRFPHAADELSASSQPPHPASQIIPFRRASPPSGPAAAGEPSPREEPAAFIPLGSAVQAVVMNLANKRIRLKVLVADTGREGDIRDES